MNNDQTIASSLKLRPAQVATTITLLDGGNTIPFIARYRKEQTGGLDEEQLRQIAATSDNLRALDARRVTILAEIEEQGKLTSELRALLDGATTRTALEDLYQPYKPKRRTRAGIARAKGLAPLAELIVQQLRTGKRLPELVAPFLSAEVVTEDEALAGARDIVAELISDHPDVRRLTRERAQQWGTLLAEKLDKAEDPRGLYQTYYAWSQRNDRVKPYQLLALNRGETEKILRVRVVIPERDWRAAIATAFRPHPASPFSEQLALAIDDAAERLLLPAIERDVRRTLTSMADVHAIGVFAANLRALLGQPPLSGHTVGGLDPGFRSGCKVAVVDPTGKVLETATIYPHAPQAHSEAARRTLVDLMQRHGITLWAIGNGTASRETEQLIADLLRGQSAVHYLLVSEAGASVYSASPLARAELPGLDVSLRGAVSIARRVQDPLAELVKIEPKAIGIGLYQHDVDQTQLAAALTEVVESVVNSVGVDLNTASPALLTYVSGIGPKLADRIVTYRETHGPFLNRMTLGSVQGLGPKAFEQSAGFLRVRGGTEPLDATAIHPESYRIARQVVSRIPISEHATQSERRAALDALRAESSLEALASELATGVPTLQDILEQLARPGRDPREDLPPPILRRDVLSLADLKPGLRLQGTVRNVVDFGAFVDIGVKNDGLLHQSQMPRGVHLHVGDIVDVEIQTIESERGRIALGWVQAG
ncbi:MAG: Tex family protein [Herpetosiphon sp.]